MGKRNDMSKYPDFMRQVDEHLYRLIGFDNEFLADWKYADDYRAGRTPLATAKRAIRHNRECF